MNCIVFDKTGTLTVGKPVVVGTRLLKTIALRGFYELIAAAEVILLSQHIFIFMFCFLNVLSPTRIPNL